MRIDQFIMPQEALDRFADVLFLAGPDGEFLDANAAALKCYGHPHTSMLGLRPDDIVEPHDANDGATPVPEIAFCGGGVRETRHLRADGSSFPAEVWSTPVVVDGEHASLCLVHDITERRLLEAALAASESRLKAVFERAPVGIVLLESPTARFVEANESFFQITGWSAEDLLVRGVEGITHTEDFELECRQFAKMSAGETSGFTMAKRYLRPDGTTVWAIVTVSRLVAENLFVCMVEDITLDKEAEELAIRQAERIERTLTSVIDIAGAIGELRDPYTAGHQRRVSELAARMAQELGMSDLDVADIRVAGLLHDIGKAAVPTEILGKPGLISPVELDLIKGHAEAGYRIAVSANLEEPIPELIYQHHERCNGSGYPRGLVGDQILSGAKVLVVADVVEAMMSHRPYRPALGIEAALAEIERGAGRLYDAEVCKACVALFREQGFKFSDRPVPRGLSDATTEARKKNDTENVSPTGMRAIV